MAAAQTPSRYGRVDMYHRRDLNAFLVHASNMAQFTATTGAVDPAYADLPLGLLHHCSETLARRILLTVRRPGSLLLAHATKRNADCFVLSAVQTIATTRRPFSGGYIDGQEFVTLVEVVCEPPPQPHSKPLRHYFAMLPYHSRSATVDWYRNAFPLDSQHVITRADCLTFFVDPAVFAVPAVPRRAAGGDSLAAQALRAYATDLIMRHLRSGRVLELARADVAAAGVAEDVVPRVFAEVMRQLQFRGSMKVSVAQPAACKYEGSCT